jgi:hypothetical protein
MIVMRINPIWEKKGLVRKLGMLQAGEEREE